VTLDRVQISSLRDKHDSSPRRVPVAWAKFIEAFAKSRWPICLVAACKQRARIHNNGRAWLPAILVKGPYAHPTALIKD
jgi:hypothetical protein